MSYTIAITGKGGTGKTTVSGFLVRLLWVRGIRPILAVDADPNGTLAPMIGLSVGPTLGDIREEMMEKKSEVTGISKERILDLKLEECIQESDGFDLLALGRSEGPSCYCYVNNLLRQALAKFKTQYKVMVIDNEAGMEHLSRMNMNVIDCQVLVCEPTIVSARAADRILTLTQSLPITIKRKVLVWNKVTRDGVSDEAKRVVMEKRFDAVLHLPADENVMRLSVAEESVMTARMPEAFANLSEACFINDLVKEQVRI
jgi:CO dehydrogenase maturation factor